MKIRYVVIREPISLEDPFALRIWQRALWAKAASYRAHYKSGILPLALDDFIATHLIVARELPDGELEPMVMYKSLERSIAQRYSMEWGFMSLLELLPQSERNQIEMLLKDQSEVTYDSSWAKNPRYEHGLVSAQTLRNHITALGLLYHESYGLPRWLTAGVVALRIDQYFSWLGCTQISKEFSLPIIDQQTVKIFYMGSAKQISTDAIQVCDQHMNHWHRRLEFAPERIQTKKVA